MIRLDMNLNGIHYLKNHVCSMGLNPEFTGSVVRVRVVHHAFNLWDTNK